MQSFSRGWSFLTQAWGMAFKDKDLIRPSIYALLVGAIVSILGIIPIVGAYLLLGNSGIGQVLTFALGALMVFVNFVVTYVFSGMTAYLIFGYLSEGDGRMDRAWAIVKRDFFDILTLAAASTAVNMLKSLANRRNQRGGANILAGLARSAVGLMEVLWTEAAFSSFRLKFKHIARRLFASPQRYAAPFAMMTPARQRASLRSAFLVPDGHPGSDQWASVHTRIRKGGVSIGIGPRGTAERLAAIPVDANINKI